MGTTTGHGVQGQAAGPGRWTATFDGEAAFSALQTAFARALRISPDQLCESSYTFAGGAVRMRIVGRELADHIVRPFSHLRITQVPPPAPQLTIDLWDESRTEVRLQVARANNNPEWAEVTMMSSDGRYIGQRLPNTFTCLDRKADHMVGSVRWIESIFIYERGKPFTRPLVMWHNDRDVQVIHAALVSRDTHGVLLVGKSGSGKSSSALACLCDGLNFLSEDFVGLQALGDGSFVGHSLYNSVFLDTRDLARFPALIPAAIRGRLPHEEKSLILLSQVFPMRLVPSVSIRALALPRLVNGCTPRIRPASRGEALLALAPSSLLMPLSPGAEGLARLVRLVERVPAYWLELGRDQGDVSQRVDEILAETVRA